MDIIGTPAGMFRYEEIYLIHGFPIYTRIILLLRVHMCIHQWTGYNKTFDLQIVDNYYHSGGQPTVADKTISKPHNITITII